LLRGLSDQTIDYEILTRKPRDLSEAVDMIVWHEACKQYTMSPTEAYFSINEEGTIYTLLGFTRYRFQMSAWTIN